jgi:hypothetical protein
VAAPHWRVPVRPDLFPGPLDIKRSVRSGLTRTSSDKWMDLGHRILIGRSRNKREGGLTPTTVSAIAGNEVRLWNQTPVKLQEVSEAGKRMTAFRRTRRTRWFGLGLRLHPEEGKGVAGDRRGGRVLRESSG